MFRMVPRGLPGGLIAQKVNHAFSAIVAKAALFTDYKVNSNIRSHSDGPLGQLDSCRQNIGAFLTLQRELLNFPPPTPPTPLSSL